MEIKTPVSATLSPEQISAIQAAAGKYKAVKGGVMPALHAVQGICGNWLPLEALRLLSEGLDIPYSYLYGVMSFYTMAFMGMMPFGSLLAGSLASRIGAPATVMASGAACIVAAGAFALALPAVRAAVRADRSDPGR